MPLEPSSSLTAVVTKSTGSERDHCWIVLGFSSGDENRIVSTTDERQHDAERDAELLDQVVRAVAALPVASGLVLETSTLAPGHADPSGEESRAGLSSRASWNGGTTPCLRTSST